MRAIATLLLICSACGTLTSANTGSTPAAGSALPVREVTVFKDGHAFVQREGRVTTAAGGAIVLEELPMPVLGTFWPFARGGAKLVSATAAPQRVSIERTALGIAEILRANVGAEVDLVDVANEHTVGTLVGIPARSAEELERTDLPGNAPKLPQLGSMALVRTQDGTKVIALERVRDVVIRGELRARLASEEVRNRLTLRVSGVPDGAAAEVGLAYVQKGLRWIPSYKVDIDGAGKARIVLEATLVNDLVDLEDATVNLVIGVPRFEFESLVDPISLQSALAELAQQSQAPDRFSNMLSNSIMTQSAEYSVQEPAGGSARTLTASEGESNEDLFVYTLQHVSLKRGERMVLVVNESQLSYKDVYVLDVPFAPPMDMRDHFQGERMASLARALAAPKVKHVLRLKNETGSPLTTSPALMLLRGRVLAQGRMSYTPVGAETDLEMTVATDVCVETSENEAKRTPNAVRWGSEDYHRIDLTGSLVLENKKKEAITLEVKKSVLGLVDGADHDGQPLQSSLADIWAANGHPEWWGFWNWPYWWWRWNGVGNFTWKLELKPGEKVTLGTTWHYFWR